MPSGLQSAYRRDAETYEKICESSKRRDGFEFFTVLVWRDVEARTAGHAALGLDDNRYQDGSALLERVTHTPESV